MLAILQLLDRSGWSLVFSAMVALRAERHLKIRGCL